MSHLHVSIVAQNTVALKRAFFFATRGWCLEGQVVGPGFLKEQCVRYFVLLPGCQISALLVDMLGCLSTEIITLWQPRTPKVSVFYQPNISCVTC